MHFLDVPSEIIILILQEIPIVNLGSCVQTNNRLLRATIVDSLVLRYGAAKQMACVEDTPYSVERYCLSERLEHLQDTQRAWLNLRIPSSAPSPLASNARKFTTSHRICISSAGPRIHSHRCPPGSYTHPFPLLKIRRISPGPPSK